MASCLTVHARLPGGVVVPVDVAAGDGVAELTEAVAEAAGMEKLALKILHEGGELKECGGLVQDDVLEVVVEEGVMERAMLVEEGYTLTVDGANQAVSRGDTLLAKRFFKAGLAPSRHGTGPSIRKGHFKTILELIKIKCVTYQNVNYYDLSRLFSMRGFDEVLPCFSKPDLNDILFELCGDYRHGDNPQFASRLLDLGADVNVGKYGTTALGKAAVGRKVKTFTLLLERGAVLGERLEEKIMNKGRTKIAAVAVKHGVDASKHLSRWERKSGLTFPVPRVRRNTMKQTHRMMNRRPAVLLTAVLEYITMELLTLSSKIAHKNPRRPHMITPRHINEAIRTDTDLAPLCSTVSIASSGVVGHVYAALKKKSTRRTKKT